MILRENKKTTNHSNSSRINNESSCTVCVSVRMTWMRKREREWERERANKQMMMVIVFRVQSNNLYELNVVCCWNAMPKAFPLEYESSYSRFCTLSISYCSTYIYNTCIRTHVLSLSPSLCIVFTHISHIQIRTECMVWLLSDILCDSNAGECDFVHMPSKYMVELVYCCCSCFGCCCCCCCLFSVLLFDRV